MWCWWSRCWTRRWRRRRSGASTASAKRATPGCTALWCAPVRVEPPSYIVLCRSWLWAPFSDLQILHLMLAKQESIINLCAGKAVQLCAVRMRWRTARPSGAVQIPFLCTACSSGGRVAAGDCKRGGERAPAVRIPRRRHGPVGHRAAPVGGAAVRAVHQTCGCPFMGSCGRGNQRVQQADGLAVTQCKRSSLLPLGDLLSLTA